jgi:hypothetical protein
MFWLLLLLSYAAAAPPAALIVSNDLLYPSSFNPRATCQQITAPFACTTAYPFTYDAISSHDFVSSASGPYGDPITDYASLLTADVVHQGFWFGVKYHCNHWTSTTVCGGATVLSPIAPPNVKECSSLQAVVCVCEGGTPLVRDDPFAIRQVVVGSKSACMLLNKGDVYCNGDPSSGEFPFWETTEVNRLLPLPGVVTEIYGQFTTFAARFTSGDIVLWGNYSTYDPSSFIVRPLPAVQAAVTTIVFSYFATCVLLADRTVWCMGVDLDSLEDPPALSTEFVKIDVENVRSLNAGYTALCALTFEGAIWCWGHETGGEFGDGES